MERLSLSGNSLSGTLPDSMCDGLPRLERLIMSTNRLHGGIPANLSGCSNLRFLYLHTNAFTGPIPRTIGNLRQLEHLSLGINNLTGGIPEELGNITTLTKLEVSENYLTGAIPAKIFNISSLQYINVFRNNLSGSLPPDMCSNLQQLEEFYVNDNQIGGYIPTRLYECTALRSFHVSLNKFVGPIPREIGNITLLQTLYLSVNHLTGTIPSEIGNLQNLEEFALDENNIIGTVPTSLWNMSALRVLSLLFNELTGNLPADLGLGLPNLEQLHVGDNNLTSESPDLSFITSLANCRNLQQLAIASNPLNGVLPASIGNLSTTLEIFRAYNCSLRGPIPDEIGNLSGLQSLGLHWNHLTGPIPETLANLRGLQGLFLTQNEFSGAFPSAAICGLQSLTILVLSETDIHGAIPECMGNLTTLRLLEMTDNNLDSIPQSLWHLPNLLRLNLSSNSFIGSLPQEIGYMKVASDIDLSNNQFSGIIPSTIGTLHDLTLLSLAGNKLEGSIPESIADMVALESLDLSQNNLSGMIPMSLEELQNLRYFNVSFNDLSGEIPAGGPFRNFTRESFISNEGLCGDSRYQVSPCPEMQTVRPKRKLKLTVILSSVGASIFFVLVIVLAYGFVRYRRKGIPQSSSDVNPEISPLRVSYYELLEATDDFSQTNLLGSGSFGSVYKGTLRNGMVVAAKVFHSNVEQAFKSFEQECEVLRNIRHRNLCKVVGSCSNLDFKALVLEYMPNGSLEKWLYSFNSCLDIIQRTSIMIDVASALEYLHHGYATPIVHCDLKPSNVLLDEDMVAHLCDFGIAKLISEDESSIRTMTLATIGYIAPEFGLEGRVSVRCDVYSYGIMLMEVFTRRKPGDETFAANLNLRSWVSGSMPDDFAHVIDSNLLSPDEESSWSTLKLNCLHSIMELALNCSDESPHERISMKDAAASLKKIRDRLIAHRARPNPTI